MRGTYSFSKRLLAIVICIAMVAAYLPGMALTTSAETVDNRTVDPHTLDQWKQYFGVFENHANNVSLTTEFAGAVWTDKSVFDPSEALPTQLTGAKYNGNSFPITDEGDNFLISLSAIASNKEIVGYSTIPTDTVFVLDLSSSMRSNDDEGGSAIDELVLATNKAIADLLALNKNNRVAVVLYAGNTSGEFNSNPGVTNVILPLDTYTAATAGTYLRSAASGGDADYAIEVASGVTGSNGTVTGRLDSARGTFTQDGIFEAMQVFLNVTDTKVAEGVQAGTARLPIMVLMTDGEPTLANRNYDGTSSTDLGNSEIYLKFNNADYNHRDTIAWLTQLTAAYAKREISQHYENESGALFYTLAFGEESTRLEEARSVVNPANTSATLNGFWTDFLAGRSVNVYTYTENRQTRYYTTSNDTTEPLTAADKVYVDKFFEADSDQAMFNAFADIVDEIIIQSKYYPTYVKNDHDHDGYLTFVDKIGEYMEVTGVKGIIVGNRLFSGAALSQRFENGGFGTIDSPNTYGNNLVWSVMERLGIADKQIAQALLNDAYEHGQLAYENDQNFSHYIGWFAKQDAAGNAEYVDFWHEGMTQEQIDKAVNEEGATHIIKSYGFLGDTSAVPGVSDTDMMYMTVRISTQISTGESLVVWQIPAALVPTITYEVEVTVDSDGKITELNSLGLERGTADSPIRLVYEVALQEDIHDWNLTQKVADTYKNSTENKEEGYVFYSNKWTEAAEDTDRNTYSHFEPSVQNERYYYTQDNVVLRKVGDSYQVYTGSKPTGGSYYHSLQVYEKLENGQLRIHTHYEPISAEAMESVKADGSQWIIPKGTVHRYYDFEISQKEQNPTGTMHHSDHPFVVWNDATGHYYTYSTQGNNGMLTVTPATGIKLTKTLAEGYTSTEEFTFTITGDLTNAVLVTLDENGNEAQRDDLTSSQITLSAGETVYIIGLTAGNYTVTENTTGKNYKVSSVKIDRVNAGSTEAAVTLTNQDITEVEFTNAPKGYGDLEITKTVQHHFSARPAALATKVFTAKVHLGAGTYAVEGLLNADGTASTATTVTADSNGDITLYLTAEHVTTIKNLREGTAYTVEETNIPAGFRWEQAASVGLFGSITANATAEAHLVNTYVSTPITPDIQIQGSKIISGDPYSGNASFEVAVEEYVGIGAEGADADGYRELCRTSLAVGQPYLANLGDLGVSYTDVGTHYYRVREIDGGEDHFTYDSTLGLFRVVVTDDGMNGTLEYKVENVDGTTVTDATATAPAIVTKNFVNIYSTNGTHVDINITKRLINDTGVDIPLNNFHFALYEDGGTTPLADYTVTTDASGHATIRVPVLELPTGGVLKYDLREIAGTVSGMTYDSTVYNITITVTDNGTGQLVAVVTVDGINETNTANTITVLPTDGTHTFTNTYDLADTSKALNVTKIYWNASTDAPMTSGTFVFELFKSDANYQPVGSALDTLTLTVDDDGRISGSFDAITYESVGPNYYLIHERVDDPQPYITYQTGYLPVLVNVTKATDPNGKDILVAEDYYVGDPNHETAYFTNTYHVSGTADVTLSGTKELSGRPMLSGEFTFQLTEVNASGESITDGLVLTTENDPDGNGNGVAIFRFHGISYDSIGVHYYKIEETAGHALGVSYAQNAYLVKVTVSDNGIGGLNADWQIIKTHTGEENADWVSVNGGKNVVFENTYAPASVSILLAGIKELVGRDLVDGEFAFAITETENDFETPVANGFSEIVRNDAHGNMVFGANTQKLEFTTEGKHYYLIEEDASNALVDITYDDTKYYVTVDVADNHNGYLEATVSVSKIVVQDGEELPAQTVSSIVFENGYDPTRPIKVVDKQAASLGEALTYTITYVNTTGAVADLVITDVLDPALRYEDGSAGYGVYADGTITWTIDDVPAGETVTVSFQATIKADTAATSVSNKAQIDIKNVANAIFTNEVVTQVKKADLSIKKEQSVGTGTATTEKQTVAEGDVVTYTLTITNNGDGDAYGVTVTDQVPEGLVYVDGSAETGVYTDGTITWRLHTLAAGDSEQLTFKVTVPAVEEDTIWTNVAVFVYTNNPDGPEKETESNEVEIEEILPEPTPTEPPATEPPVTEPPATEPPATEPPATEPPATEPPATEPPATEPPATEPPTTEPPATEPPVTEPPATEPPATEPPTTEPPTTEPPATEPPTTEPPATEPPATEPPATEPPAATPETGDSFQTGVFISLMVLSSFGLAAVMICKKRDEKKQKA